MAEESSAYDADVIVVGSGVAGALITHRLAEAGKSVIMLEAGPRMQRWQIVERFRNQANKMDFMGPYPASKAAPHPSNTGYDRALPNKCGRVLHVIRSTAVYSVLQCTTLYYGVLHQC